MSQANGSKPIQNNSAPAINLGEAQGLTRQSKQMELAAAIEKFVPDGVESLAVGGLFMHNNPMALVRELVRQRKHIKRLITSPAGCINADLLIGAGLVEEIVTSYVGFEHLGFAPAFTRFAKEGRLKVLEVDELTLILGLRAGGTGQPFAALPPGLELSDVSRANPDFYQPVHDPFTGATRLATPAIRPKVALILCQQADIYGNAIFKGSVFADRELIFAAEQVILQVEQVIPTRQLTKNPIPVNVPGYAVSAVVQAAFSAHPTSSHRFYHYDEAHLQEYIQMAATEAGFEAYVQKYFAEGGETEYIGRTSVIEG